MEVLFLSVWRLGGRRSECGKEDGTWVKIMGGEEGEGTVVSMKNKNL